MRPECLHWIILSHSVTSWLQLRNSYEKARWWTTFKTYEYTFLQSNNNYSNRILETSTIISYSAIVGKDSILITLEIWRPFDFISYTISTSYCGYNMLKNSSSHLKILVYEEHLIFNLYFRVLYICLKTILDLSSQFSLSRQIIPLPFLSYSSFCNQGLLLYKYRLSFPFLSLVVEPRTKLAEWCYEAQTRDKNNRRITSRS